MKDKHKAFLPVHPFYLLFLRRRKKDRKTGQGIDGAHDHENVIGPC